MHPSKRIWEIDFVRGIAVILMVIFHLVVDLSEGGFYAVDYSSGFWNLEGLLTATIFIFISGVSSTLSQSNIKRGLKIFCLGMVLTLVTYFYNPNFYIKFGILHFLGVSMIIYSLISNVSPRYAYLVAAFSIIYGLIIKNEVVQTSLLFPVGLTNSSFSSLDYYPMLPWFGVFLIGSILGKLLYKSRSSLLRYAPKHRLLAKIGKHSLAIYLIHQPVIILGVHLISMYAPR